MGSQKSIIETIKERFSCRTYQNIPIESETQERLNDFIATHKTGPFNSPTRFALVAAEETDSDDLKGLGTYGFIRNPTGFIIAATGAGEKNLEDTGYVMEQIVLYATELGLGTCWLGGSFAKSRFAKKVAASPEETVPAVTATGYILDEPRARNGGFRKTIGAVKRLHWEQLFFKDNFNTPITAEDAGDYAEPLEMVRIGPSASNKQPWRIVKDGQRWHFYLQRSRRYGNTLPFKLIGIADIQRLDMGIAMNHFEFTARELGLPGHWIVDNPQLTMPNDATEYTVSWIED